MSETITEETSVAENNTVTETNSVTENNIVNHTNSVAENDVIHETQPAVEEATTPEETAAQPANTDSKETSDVQKNAPQTQTSSQQNQNPDSNPAYKPEPEIDPFDKAEKERESSGFFARFSSKIASIHSRREAKLVRDEIILSRIPDKDLMEYLKLEQRRMESQQHAREVREKRIWIAFQMTVALVAAVLVIYFLKDSPAILISILYTAGLLIAFNIWNKHKDSHSPKDQ